MVRGQGDLLLLEEECKLVMYSHIILLILLLGLDGVIVLVGDTRVYEINNFIV